MMKSHICHSETLPAYSCYARKINHLNTYVIVKGRYMNSPWTSTVDATGLNFHCEARLLTRQNNTSCHAKSWSACSIQKQHMHANRLFKRWIFRHSHSQTVVRAVNTNAVLKCLHQILWLNRCWVTSVYTTLLRHDSFLGRRWGLRGGGEGK